MRQIIFYQFPGSSNDARGSSINEDEKLKDYQAKIEPLLDQYKNKQKAYQEAELEYNNCRAQALNASDTKAINDWALNANVYRDKVKAAMNEWLVAGHKNEVESMLESIQELKK